VPRFARPGGFDPFEGRVDRRRVESTVAHQFDRRGERDESPPDNGGYPIKGGTT
jgi:hypothetical protein